MVLSIVTLPADIPQCDRRISMMGLFRYIKIRVSLIGIPFQYLSLPKFPT